MDLGVQSTKRRDGTLDAELAVVVIEPVAFVGR
jgi:hypothetical protein